MSGPYVNPSPGGRGGAFGSKGRFRSTNLNTAMAKTTTFRTTGNAVGGLYVAFDRNRAGTAGVKSIGIAAAPTPVNIPSQRKDPRTTMSASSAIVMDAQSKVWGQSSTDQMTSQSTTSSASVKADVPSTTLQPSSRASPWSVPKSLDSEPPVTKAIVMPSWADADSDEDEDSPVHRPPRQRPIEEAPSFVMDDAKPSYASSSDVYGGAAYRSQPSWSSSARPMTSSADSRFDPSSRFSYAPQRSQDFRSSREQQQQQPVHFEVLKSNRPAQSTVAPEPTYSAAEERLAQHRALEEARKEREDLEVMRRDRELRLRREQEEAMPQQQQQWSSSSEYSSQYREARVQDEGRWERARPSAGTVTYPSQPPPGFRQPTRTQQDYKQPAPSPLGILKKSATVAIPTEAETEVSAVRDMTKSFASLFAEDGEPAAQSDSAPHSAPIEILRNANAGSRKMLFDPKKGVLVESMDAAPPKAKQPERTTIIRQNELKDRDKDKLLRRKQDSVTAAEVPAEGVAKKGSKRSAAQTSEPVVVDSAQALLKAKRDAERLNRPPRTKGVLYEFSESGELNQVLSAPEREEMQMRQEAMAQQRQRLEKEAAEVEMAKKVSASTKPAWQAPSQTLVDLGVASNKTKAPPVLVDKKGKVPKNAEKRKARKQELKRNKEERSLPNNEQLPPPSFLLSDADADASDLDIRNQNTLSRDPSSYSTFIPGSGLSATVDPWTPSLHFAQLSDISVGGYHLAGLGIESDITDPSNWGNFQGGLSVWAGPSNSSYLALDAESAVLSSVAYAIGADDTHSERSTNEIVIEPTVIRDDALKLPAQRPVAQSRGRRGPPRIPIESQQQQHSTDGPPRERAPRMEAAESRGGGGRGRGRSSVRGRGRSTGRGNSRGRGGGAKAAASET